MHAWHQYHSCCQGYAGRICSKNACSKNISAAHKIKVNSRKKRGARGSGGACCSLVGICQQPSKKMLSRWALRSSRTRVFPPFASLTYYRRLLMSGYSFALQGSKTKLSEDCYSVRSYAINMLGLAR